MNYPIAPMQHNSSQQQQQAQMMQQQQQHQQMGQQVGQQMGQLMGPQMGPQMGQQMQHMMQMQQQFPPEYLHYFSAMLQRGGGMFPPGMPPPYMMPPMPSPNGSAPGAGVGMNPLDFPNQAAAPSKSSAQSSQKKASKKRKAESSAGSSGESKRQRNDDADKGNRVVWTPELHSKFIEAYNRLGDKAVPKRILEEMNVEGLCRENIASHLQKFRLALKKRSAGDSANSKLLNGIDEEEVLDLAIDVQRREELRLKGLKSSDSSPPLSKKSKKSSKKSKKGKKASKQKRSSGSGPSSDGDSLSMPTSFFPAPPNLMFPGFMPSEGAFVQPPQNPPYQRPLRAITPGTSERLKNGRTSALGEDDVGMLLMTLAQKQEAEEDIPIPEPSVGSLRTLADTDDDELARLTEMHSLRSPNFFPHTIGGIPAPRGIITPRATRAGGDIPPSTDAASIAQRVPSGEQGIYDANGRLIVEHPVGIRSLEKMRQVEEKLRRNVTIRSTFSDEQLRALMERVVLHKYLPKSVVIRQDDVADKSFYIVESGTLAVLQDGVCIDILGNGKKDAFGELASVYNCKRTTTVVTQTSCELWYLDGKTMSSIVNSGRSTPDPFAAPSEVHDDYKPFRLEDSGKIDSSGLFGVDVQS